MQQAITQRFKELFNNKATLFQAPGRINLIGEHTDYNEGFVFPAAINRYIILAISPNHSNIARMHAYNLNESYETNISQIEKSDKSWANYILGVIAQFRQKGLEIGGFDCVFGGNIPQGAGLSSSAALESVFTFAFNQLYQHQLATIEMIQIAQRAEVEFVGVNCGIMDQFISFSGKKDSAIALDCRNLNYTYAEVHLEGYEWLLADTLVKHSLASSEYNIRRQECEKGVAILHQHYPQIKSLRDADVKHLETVKAQLPKTIYQRCMYVIEENKRVKLAIQYLQAGNAIAFGKLLYACHQGLSQQYEVSCAELDFLVQTAKESQMAAGARMMGGGFGGCTLNVVNTKHTPAFKQLLSHKFEEQFGFAPQFYAVKIVNGVGTI